MTIHIPTPTEAAAMAAALPPTERDVAADLQRQAKTTIDNPDSTLYEIFNAQDALVATITGIGHVDTAEMSDDDWTAYGHLVDAAMEADLS